MSPHKKYEDTYRETLKESKAVYSTMKPAQETYRSNNFAQMSTTTPRRNSPDKERKSTNRNSFI